MEGYFKWFFLCFPEWDSLWWFLVSCCPCAICSYAMWHWTGTCDSAQSPATARVPALSWGQNMTCIDEIYEHLLSELLLHVILLFLSSAQNSYCRNYQAFLLCCFPSISLFKPHLIYSLLECQSWFTLLVRNLNIVSLQKKRSEVPQWL